jgi:hypothetical protein
MAVVFCEIMVADKCEWPGMSLMGWLSVVVTVTVAGWVILALSVIFTSPVALGPAGVTLWFLVFYIALAGLLTLGLFAVKSYMHVHVTAVVRLRYAQRQALLVSGMVTGILALSSLQQLAWLDVILLGLILLVVEVYVRFRWP